jgi:hypothetical protein
MGVVALSKRAVRRDEISSDFEKFREIASGNLGFSSLFQDEKEILQNPEEVSLDIVNILLVEWYLMLTGVDAQPTSPERHAAYLEFLKQFVNGMDRTERSRLIACWRAVPDLQRASIEMAKSIPDRKQRPDTTPLLRKRQAVNRLRAEFNKILVAP